MYNWNQFRNFPKFSDLVEADNLVYIAYAKVEEAVVVEKPKAKSKDKPKIEE